MNRFLAQVVVIFCAFALLFVQGCGGGSIAGEPRDTNNPIPVVQPAPAPAPVVQEVSRYEVVPRPWKKPILSIYLIQNDTSSRYEKWNSDFVSSVNDWNQKVGNTVTLQRIQNVEDADISIEAIASEKTDQGYDAVSEITISADGYTKKSKVKIGNIVKSASLFDVLRHEIAHSLGSSGHSQSNTDLLYPLYGYVHEISPADVGTVEWVWQQIPTPVPQTKSQKEYTIAIE